MQNIPLDVPHRPLPRSPSPPASGLGHLASLLRSLAPVLCLLAAAGVSAQPYTPGGTYHGAHGYVEYRAGDLPIILTAGHGGDLEPAGIPERTYGTKVRDTNTRELAIACYDEIARRTGRHPHLVISHLHRNRLDPNREIVEAAQGNALAEQAWHEFNDFIAAARDTARAGFGFGHVIDLHGHGHAIPRLELGYALGATEINQSDTALNSPGYLWMSTLRTLALARPGVPFHELLRGPRSLGDFFNDRGFPAWPSPDYPSPGAAEFFDGGHIVRTHSCLLDNATVHGVQIETHYTGVRDSDTSRAAFAAALCQVLQPWLYDNYGYSIGTLSQFSLRPPGVSALERGGPPLTLTVDREGYISYVANLGLSFGGTAVPGQDYAISTETLAFASRQSGASLTITPLSPSIAGGDKTITIAIAPNLRQSASTAAITLTLGDGLTPTVRAAAVAPLVGEAAGPSRFRLTRTHAAAPLTVPLAWSGTTRAEADYFDAPASATFPAGVSALELAVPLVNDGRAGPDKTLTLSPVGSPSLAIGYPPSATVTILDDDRPAGLAVWLRGDLSGNIALDSSGEEHHAATLPADSPLATGPVQLVVPSASGAPAIDFDGVNDTVALPRFTLDPEGAFTLAFFVRLDDGGPIGNQNLASYGTRSAEGSLHLYLATTNPAAGTVALRTNLPGLAANALDVARTSPDSWQDGAWRHYALAVGADGTARVYIDGVLRRTASGRAGALAADQLLWLGWRPASGGAAGFMDGAMRDVRLYRRALPAAEITSLASSRLSFPAWLAAHGLPAAFGSATDLDAEGASLFLGYAFGAAPGAAAPRRELSHAGGRLSLSFLRESAASDLVWIVEGTNALTDAWHPLARRAYADAAWTVFSSGANVLENNDHVIVTDSVLLSAQPARFLRLRVEKTP